MPNSTTPTRSRAKDALWYAAAASAVAGLAAPTAEAQVTYVDISPDLEIQDSGESPGDSPFTLDFDGDGDAEILLWEDNGRSYTGSSFLVGDDADEGPDAVTAIIGNLIPFNGTDYAYYLPLEAGSTISSGADVVAGYYSTLATFTFGGSDPNGLIGIGDTYIGYQFQLDGEDGTTHYAWVRIEMPEEGLIIFKDYAFNATPDEPIEAGEGMPTAGEEEASSLDGALARIDAYPNPFAGELDFQLQVAAAQEVEVAVYDVLGRQVATLHEGVLAANTEHSFKLNGADLPNGLYLIQARGEQFTETTRVTLAR